jgi:hypothetical protein
MAQIRMRINVRGQLNSDYHDVQRGDVIEVDDDSALRYYRSGYAQPEWVKELGPGYQPYNGEMP